MEFVNCNLCGLQDYIIAVQGRDRSHDGREKFTIVRCKGCGLLYLNPRPDQTEILNYYPQEYSPYVTAIEEEPSLLRQWNRRYGLSKRRKLITNLVDKPGRILDVGCATGTLLNEFSKEGWLCHGVEINSRAARYAIEKFGLDIFAGTLEEARFPSEYFDVIMLWDVLEHLPNPKQTLSELARIIRPDGYLVITIPDPESIEAKIFGSAWAGYEIPRHFYLFAKSVLYQYLALANFRPVQTLYFTGGHSALALSVKFLLADLTIPKWSKQLIEAVVRSLPIRLAVWPYYFVLGRLKSSSIMTVIARKM